MIENNILSISNAMFKNKNDWAKVTEDQKDQFFFIFNRYFSKKHIELSKSLNHKEINKSIGMDLWFEFMKNKPYPQWFWSKSSKVDSKDEISEKDVLELKKKLDLKNDEIEFLIKHHRTEIIEELEYLKKSTK